jgi:hypothetical protein
MPKRRGGLQIKDRTGSWQLQGSTLVGLALVVCCPLCHAFVLHHLSSDGHSTLHHAKCQCCLCRCGLAARDSQMQSWRAQRNLGKIGPTLLATVTTSGGDVAQMRETYNKQCTGQATESSMVSGHACNQQSLEVVRSTTTQTDIQAKHSSQTSRHGPIMQKQAVPSCFGQARAGWL